MRATRHYVGVGLLIVGIGGSIVASASLLSCGTRYGDATSATSDPNDASNSNNNNNSNDKGDALGSRDGNDGPGIPDADPTYDSPSTPHNPSIDAAMTCRPTFSETFDSSIWYDDFEMQVVDKGTLSWMAQGFTAGAAVVEATPQGSAYVIHSFTGTCSVEIDFWIFRPNLTASDVDILRFDLSAAGSTATLTWTADGALTAHFNSGIVLTVISKLSAAKWHHINAIIGNALTTPVLIDDQPFNIPLNIGVPKSISLGIINVSGSAPDEIHYDQLTLQ